MKVSLTATHSFLVASVAIVASLASTDASAARSEHSANHGTPTAIAFGGDCDLPSPCVVEASDSGWELSCQPGWDGSVPRFSASLDAAGRMKLESESGDLECSQLVGRGGKFMGSCSKTVKPDPESDATETRSCNVEVHTKVEPVAYSAQLPPEITGFTACGVNYGDCKVAQSAADLTLKCVADGKEVQLRASMTGDTFQYWYRSEDEQWFDCSGEWDGQRVASSCKQFVAADSTEQPVICDDFGFNAVADNAHGECAQVLPEEGFTLQGCDMDSACVAVQRGCVWQINCGEESYSGRIRGRGEMKFRNHQGESCVARVAADGTLVGTCTSDIFSWLQNWQSAEPGDSFMCSFRGVEPKPAEGCFQMPSKISTAGCGAFFEDCTVYQDGCNFMTRCESGRYSFFGSVASDGISFQGLAGYTCDADLVEEDGKQRLLGGCTRPNEQGELQGCFEFFGPGKPTLQLDWDQ